MIMKREIHIKVTIDWPDYEDVCDELILEDSGIYDLVKNGVSIELNQTPNNHESNNPL